MPTPYSYDLRAKAVCAYHRGEKKLEQNRALVVCSQDLDEAEN